MANRETRPLSRLQPRSLNNDAFGSTTNLEGGGDIPSTSSGGIHQSVFPQSAPSMANIRRFSLDHSDTEETDEDGPEVPNPDITNEYGAYDPDELQGMELPSEVREVLEYIKRYSPQTIELDCKLKPFIPDYIPAVGDIDAFIKVTRPDKREETALGFTVLDEPSIKQSDPTVLDLQFRAMSKYSASKTTAVKTLPNAENNSKEIEKWIKNIGDLHRAKPSPVVHYTTTMPSVDYIMQEWEPEFEELLKELQLPSTDLNCSLEEYVDIVCGIFDIPTHKSRIQALHLLFTVFAEFKNSQHFKALADENKMDNSENPADTNDHLILDSQ